MDRSRAWRRPAPAQVPCQTTLAAVAFVRLLTELPVTPGGLGITELGLIATLGAGHRDVAQATAAVLPYWAVTYLPPIPSARSPAWYGGTRPASSAPARTTPARQAPLTGTSPSPRQPIPQPDNVNARRSLRWPAKGERGDDDVIAPASPCS